MKLLFRDKTFEEPPGDPYPDLLVIDRMQILRSQSQASASPLDPLPVIEISRADEAKLIEMGYKDLARFSEFYGCTVRVET